MSLVSEISKVESRCSFSHLWISVSIEDLLAHGAVKRGSIYEMVKNKWTDFDHNMQLQRICRGDGMEYMVVLKTAA